MSEEKKEFAIKDRRIFADENKKSPSEDSDSSKKQEPEIQMPEVNFATFIISLNASALVNLGVIADPATGKEVKNLAVGKQTIDILSMMEEKTRGNLTPEEENMLKNILYDLRIIFVKEHG